MDLYQGLAHVAARCPALKEGGGCNKVQRGYVHGINRFAGLDIHDVDLSL